jgi:hypothetical protein
MQQGQNPKTRAKSKTPTTISTDRHNITIPLQRDRRKPPINDERSKVQKHMDATFFHNDSDYPTAT